MTRTEVESILVIRFDALGDMILFWGFLDALGRAHPRARIHVITKPHTARLVDVFRCSALFHPVDIDVSAYVANASGSIATHIQNLLSEISPELVILPEWNLVWLSQLIAASANAPIIAFNREWHVQEQHLQLQDLLGAREERYLGNLQVVEGVPADIHEPEKYRRLYKYLFAGTEYDNRLELLISTPARILADELLVSGGVREEKFFIAFLQTGDGGARSLPMRHWIAVVERLEMDMGARPVFLASSRDDVSHLTELPNIKFIRVDVNRIDVTAAILERAVAYAGADTGPMHLASALGCPVFAVYGGGTWPRFLPAWPSWLAIHMPLSCFGCGWQCPFPSRECLSAMVESELVSAAREFAGLVSKAEPFQRNVAIKNSHVENPLRRVLRDINLETRTRHHQVLQSIAALSKRIELCESPAAVSNKHREWLDSLAAWRPSVDSAINLLTDFAHADTENNRTRDELLGKIGSDLGEISQHVERLEQRSSELAAIVNNLKDSAGVICEQLTHLQRSDGFAARIDTLCNRLDEMVGDVERLRVSVRDVARSTENCRTINEQRDAELRETLQSYVNEIRNVGAELDKLAILHVDAQNSVNQFRETITADVAQKGVAISGIVREIESLKLEQGEIRRMLATHSEGVSSEISVLTAECRRRLSSAEERLLQLSQIGPITRRLRRL
jgi:ADP-heptose:LPS heptosyltransferase